MRAEEAAEAAGLLREVISGLTVYNERAVASELAKYTNNSILGMDVLVATVDGALAGVAVTRSDDGLTWIDWVAVREGFRGMGIARGLLLGVVDEAATAGHHKVWCDCRSDNHASRGMLRGAGFRPITFLGNHWYGQDYILWERGV